jgi:hypothetical protein
MLVAVSRIVGVEAEIGPIEPTLVAGSARSPAKARDFHAQTVNS